MHGNADFSKLFRARPLRFVLPMKKPKPNTPPEHNLIDIETVYQSTEMFQDVNDESADRRLNRDINGDTTDIQYDNKPKYSRNEHKRVLEKKPTAHQLLNGKIFVKPELLCDVGCETPRINMDFHLGKEYRYFYAIACDMDLNNPGTVSVFHELLKYIAYSIRDCEFVSLSHNLVRRYILLYKYVSINKNKKN